MRTCRAPSSHALPPAYAAKMGEVEASSGLPRSNRMFFLSIPPNVFIAAAGGAADVCSTRCARAAARSNQQQA
jgi:hypothetical protein